MTPPAETVSIPVERLKRSTRAEAAIEPPPVAPTPVTKETQIIAIYGKGGIGKSFTLANLSYCLLYTSPSPRDLSTSRMPSSA